MSFRIQLRRDTANAWSTINPILIESEFGYEIDTRKAKIGDGINNWNDLPYWPDTNKLDLYGPTGPFQIGATGIGITGGGVTTEVIDGISYYNIERSNTRSYCVRLEYNEINEFPSPNPHIPNPITVLSGNWTSTGISVTTDNDPRPTAIFSFTNEQTPPKNIYGYFYNAIGDRYKLSTFGVGSIDYIKTSILNSNKTSHIVSNDFFSNFSNNHKIEIDMTASGYGAQRNPNTNNNAHAYVIFTF